jgi:RecG-like helicase
MSSPLVVKPDDAIITPVYHLTKGLYNKTLIRIMKSALSYLEDKEFIPTEILKKYKLISHKQAIENIHFPKSQMHLRQARRRPIFEELFLLKTGQLMLKAKNRIAKTEPILNADLSGFYASLPFTLTASQQNAINECLSDMQKTTPMNRLLQGDVGCGKTAVAAALIYATKQSGKQSVLMAPTGILAFQHYKTMQKMLPNLNIALLLGTTKKKEKEHLKSLNSVLAGEIPESDVNDYAAQSYRANSNYHQNSNQEEKDHDSFLATDAIAMEKYVSGAYNFDLFQFGNNKLRRLLADIEVEEQNHAEMLYKYKVANAMA